jgi:hypothetical protein
VRQHPKSAPRISASVSLLCVALPLSQPSIGMHTSHSGVIPRTQFAYHSTRSPLTGARVPQAQAHRAGSVSPAPRALPRITRHGRLGGHSESQSASRRVYMR